MAKKIWKAGNMVYPVPPALVSCGTNDASYNAITIAWTGTVCTNPPMTYVSIRPSRHSYQIIKESGAFCINLTTKRMVKGMDYCGVRSGKDEDKAEKVGFHYEMTPYNTPLIQESPVNILCQVQEIIPLGSHDMFLAKVVEVRVDEKYLDDQAKLHMEAMELVSFIHGAYYGMGDLLGTFGYSVAKPKTLLKKKGRLKKTPRAKGSDR